MQRIRLIEGRKGSSYQVCIASHTYLYMSCFKLSRKMCQNLGSICSKFWWGVAKDERKFQWVAWCKMCTRKREVALDSDTLQLLAKLS